MVCRYDRAPIKATQTPEGFIIDTPVLSRVGIFTYRRADGSIQREFRPPEEVFSATHLDSLYGKPITEDHHGIVNGENSRSKLIGTVMSKGRQDGEDLRADVAIHDAAPVRAGKKELSLGYTLDLEETPGEWNGQRYDAIQRNLRVNHLALVTRGRAGTARLNLDAADAVAATDEDDTTMSLVKVRLDSGIEYDAAPEVVAALAAAAAASATMKTRADAAEAARDGLQAKVDAHADALKAAREDGQRAAAARVKLEADAKACGVEVRADQADADVRKAVIKAVRGDAINLDGKSDAYLEAAFDVAVEDGKKGKATAAGNRQDAAAPADKKGAPVSISAAEAQRAYNARLTNHKTEA